MRTTSLDTCEPVSKASADLLLKFVVVVLEGIDFRRRGRPGPHDAQRCRPLNVRLIQSAAQEIFKLARSARADRTGVYFF
jgi:hypothetical protein